MTELRDLEADRQMVERCRQSENRDWGELAQRINPDDADEWLDEIERLKGLLVWYDSTFNFWCAKISQFSQFTTHTTEAEAWAEARKAATK